MHAETAPSGRIAGVSAANEQVDGGVLGVAHPRQLLYSGWSERRGMDPDKREVAAEKQVDSGQWNKERYFPWRICGCTAKCL